VALHGAYSRFGADLDSFAGEVTRRLSSDGYLGFRPKSDRITVIPLSAVKRIDSPCSDDDPPPYLRTDRTPTRWQTCRQIANRPASAPRHRLTGAAPHLNLSNVSLIARSVTGVADPVVPNAPDRSRLNHIDTGRSPKWAMRTLSRW
jgi:hypothetical protein